MNAFKHTAICIASGSSLTKEDVDLCRGAGKVYAVKECVKLAPWADVLYAADGDWWENYKGMTDFQGDRWTVDVAAAKKYGLNCIDYINTCNWSNDPAYIATGGNSGFQALNLAVLQGAGRVILLGYDMGFTTNKHWWTGTLKREVRSSDYNFWIKRFCAAVPFIPAPVINCTRGGYLECFPRMDLADALAVGMGAGCGVYGEDSDNV